MAKPNYAFAKRQRDLAKQKKKEEKRLKKAAANATPEESAEPDQATPEQMPADKPAE
ncbi:MAG: hypothetical protein AB8C46_25865 [Burkholderiaceae bacterium]